MSGSINKICKYCYKSTAITSVFKFDNNFILIVIFKAIQLPALTLNKSMMISHNYLLQQLLFPSGALLPS